MLKYTEEFIDGDYFRAYMYASLKEQLEEINPSGTGVEYGGSNSVIQSMMPNVHFSSPRNYPQYDVCKPWPNDQYWDVSVTDQVLEHVLDPVAAINNMGAHSNMTVLTVPFFMYVHNCPVDCWRMTPYMVETLLRNAGFNHVDVRSWGNITAAQWCVETGGGRPPAGITRDMLFENIEWNDPKVPFVIWAIGRK